MGDTANLRSLLIHTRDGEWGVAKPDDGLVPVHVIRGTDFEPVRRGDLTTIPTRYLPAEHRARKALRPGDILIETAGGSKGRPTGRTLLIQARTLEGTEIPFTCASFARFLRVDEARINAPYLYWFLQYLYQIGEMEQHQVQHTGIARFQFTRFAEEIQVPLPPLPEQRTIAHILGTLDDKIELNRRMNETLEEMARALFKSWFVDFDPVHAKATLRNHTPNHSPLDWTVERARAYLDGMDSDIVALFPDSFVDSELGEIPEGWGVGKLKDAVDQLRDKENPLTSPSASFSHFSIPAYDEGQTPKQELGGSIKSTKTRVCPGVVLLSKLNPEIERVWLVDVSPDDQAVCSTEFLVLRTKPPFHRSYVYCLLRTSLFRQQIKSLVTGTSKSHQRAQAEAVLDLPIVFPPGALIDSFEKVAENFLSKTLNCRSASRALATLRDALLPKLVSGELRVKSQKQYD